MSEPRLQDISEQKRPEAADSDPRHPDYQAGVLALILLGIICLGIILTLSLSWRAQRRLEAIAAGGFRTEASIETDQADHLISEAGLLAGRNLPAYWHDLMTTGRLAPADFLLRLFISPDYLRQNRGDEQFIEDLYDLLSQQEMGSSAKETAQASLQETGSRIALINQLLDDNGYSGSIPLPSPPTRLRTVYVAENRPASGSEIVGRLPVQLELRLTGSQTSLRLYANDRLQISRRPSVNDPSLLNQHTLEWNTDAHSTGNYQLAVMVLTGDGRGYWQTLETYEVPVVLPLSAAQVRHERLPDTAEATSWYRLPPIADAALLNLFNAEQPIRLELFDAYRNGLADTESHPDWPTALRYRPRVLQPEPAEATASRDEETGSAFYVRATAIESQSSGPRTFSLLPALGVAEPVDQPGRFVAVMEVRDDELLITDESGQSSWQPAEAYHWQNPSGRLVRLSLSDLNGDTVDFVPYFQMTDDRYALVVPETVDTLDFDWQAMEGSAADVVITQTTSQRDYDVQQNQLRLARSVNDITFQVTGFDGTVGHYHLSILRMPHNGEFQQTLVQFPAGYHNWLWYSYLQYPAWQFEAFRPQIDWNDFIKAQATADRSLVDSGNSPAHWIRSGSPVYDGVSWRAAAVPVISHFADPRNFLDPVNIFQFEKMTFSSEVHHTDAVETMLRGTFMESGNRQGIDYAPLLVLAGRRADISPFFLAARVIQEMGRQAESPLATGSLSGYPDIYNFYNIGSTPNPEVPDGARINGARYAMFGVNPDQGEISEQEAAWLIPWNTPQRAMIGGALWISERYVQVGQDTLYLQKFDLIGSQGLFARQYAQNIQMAWAEGRRTWQAYQDTDLLDQPFVFRIPIFEGMPDKPQPWP